MRIGSSQKQSEFAKEQTTIMVLQNATSLLEKRYENFKTVSQFHENAESFAELYRI